MILTCPSCSTRYRTDAANFQPKGRRVRCSSCAHIWFQAPVEEAEVEILHESPRLGLPAPDPSNPARRTEPARQEGRTVFAARDRRRGSRFVNPAEDRLYGSGRRKRRGWLGIFGWLTIAALVVGPLAGGYLMRTSVVNAWPKSAKLYSALGIPVTASGLLIHADYNHIKRDGHGMIEVRGEIENQTDTARTIPSLQLALYSADNRELQRWTVRVGGAPLDPKARRPFRTSFPVPRKKVQVRIRFEETD